MEDSDKRHVNELLGNSLVGLEKACHLIEGYGISVGDPAYKHWKEIFHCKVRLEMAYNEFKKYTNENTKVNHG